MWYIHVWEDGIKITSIGTFKTCTEAVEWVSENLNKGVHVVEYMALSTPEEGVAMFEDS